MALTLRRERNGEWRKFWYAEIQIDGVRKIKNLGVKVRGKIPASLREKGDEPFERSREQAEEKLRQEQEESKRKGQVRHLTERLIEDKMGGRKLEYVRMAELAAKWRGVPRERTPGKAWLSWCDTLFGRLADGLPVTYLHEVKPEMAAEYLASLRASYSRKTAREAGQLLRSAFGRFLPLGMANPFEGGIARRRADDDGDTVHRRPFTVPELAALLEAAQEDAFLFPLVVTAACTGLRRGDVCRLTWKTVDLDAGVVAVKTSKTGANVEIPIFKPLRAVLTAAMAERRDSAVYVFPAAAAMVRDNPDGLTWRFKKLVASVLPDTKKAVQAVSAEAAPRLPAKLADVLEEVCRAVEAKIEGHRRERVLNVVRLYAAGQSVRDIEKLTGHARSGVSGDLHKAQKWSGQPFMPILGDGGITRRVDRLTRLGDKPDGTREMKPEGRARRASLLDWHALRVTWVTLALSAGVPMEVARLVTGHKTVEVVLKHYFKPGREHLRSVLGDKLPDVLTGGKEPPKLLLVGEMSVEGLAAKVADKSATADERKRLAALLAT